MLSNTTILLIRHAEKPGDPCAPESLIPVPRRHPPDTGLSAAGERRAQAYVDYFEHYVAHPVDGSLLPPTPIKLDYLFATADHRRRSCRPRLTLEPLAARSGLPFDCAVPNKRYRELVHKLKTDSYDNANVVVCWHHGKIRKLAKALLSEGGVRVSTLPPQSHWPRKWPCDVFGWLLQIRYDATGSADVRWVRCLHEQLMPDDNVEPPSEPTDRRHRLRGLRRLRAWWSST